MAQKTTWTDDREREENKKHIHPQPDFMFLQSVQLPAAMPMFSVCRDFDSVECNIEI